MSQKKMSYKTAEKIVDIYSSLLVKENLPELHAYGYSELQGFTIFDIDNALKIIIAYDVFNAKNPNDVATVKKYASHASSAVTHFFSSFVPDEVIPDIERLDPKDKMSLLKFLDLKGDPFNSPLYQQFSNQETHDSFLNFCLTIERSDMNYWDKVFQRLDLVLDTVDTKDQIFIINSNKEFAFKHRR